MYIQVNVGYSIGWGYPLDPTQNSEWFSTMYVYRYTCNYAYAYAHMYTVLLYILCLCV